MNLPCLAQLLLPLDLGQEQFFPIVGAVHVAGPQLCSTVAPRTALDALVPLDRPQHLRHFPGALSPGIAVLWSLPFFAPLLFLAAAAQTVKVDQFPLRSGCADTDAVVAK